MTFPTNAVCNWVKASTLTGLAALSIGDIIIARPYAHTALAPTAIRQCARKPRAQDPINAIIAFTQDHYGLTIGRDEALKISESIRLVFGLLYEASTSSPSLDTEGGPCALS